MRVVIECNAAEFAKIRWEIVDLIKRSDWKGRVHVHDGTRRTMLDTRKCRSCAAFKAHRTMRQRRASSVR